MGLFITLEGIDGSGKTTQAQYVAWYLREKGYDVLVTHEPGGTPIGEQIRRVLTSHENTNMDPRAEILLFSASRAQLMSEVIRPHLEADKVVVSDRFFDSTFAYQGYGRGLDLDALRAITRFATGGIIPDLTFLLDISTEEGIRKALQRQEAGGEWNRLDAIDGDFHRIVRMGYLELARLDPERWVVVDGLKSIEDVQDTIRRVLLERLDRVVQGESQH